jgi:hypothetical protein
MESMIESLARARAFFTQNPWFLQQLVHADFALLCQRMVRRAEHDQLIRYPWLYFDIGMMTATFDQAEVQLMPGNLLHYGSGIMYL